MPATSARRASFPAGDQERRSLIAKIHVAKKEMNLGDDDYRAMLVQQTGNLSSANCTIAELRTMIEHMKSKGFKPRKAGAPAAAGKPKPADHPFAQKARAMWISLYHLGAIDNSSEQALEAFAKRQLKVDRMQWANQQQAYKLIEALKAIADRNGWEQKVASSRGLQPVKADVALRVLKVRLVEAICHKLQTAGLVPVGWALKETAFHVGGMERDGPVPLWDLGDLDLLAKALGGKLRDGSR